MYETYTDILDRLGEPLWWDVHGVPRYDKFDPSAAAEVYADYVALITIACQGCRRQFQVAWNWQKLGLRCRAPQHYRDYHSKWNKAVGFFFGMPTFPSYDNLGSVGYGDAPNHRDNGVWEVGEARVGWERGGMCSGTTMSTDVVRIDQFWRRSYKSESGWARCRRYEKVYV